MNVNNFFSRFEWKYQFQTPKVKVGFFKMSIFEKNRVQQDNTDVQEEFIKN